jgi:hypothetical protein
MAAGHAACKPAQAPETASASDAEAPASDAAAEPPDAGPPPEGTEGLAPDGGTEPLAEVVTTDPAAAQKMFETVTAAPKATAKAGGVAGASPADKGVRELAKVAAVGMKPDGALLTGKLDEKQAAQAEITLKPGKCYALVGFSPKVTDLDLYLFLPPGILSGQDTTDDNKPVVGKPLDPMCPIAKAPITYRLGIVADQGAGEFAVQLYSKAHAGPHAAPKKK